MTNKRDDGCSCGGIGWDESYHELHRYGCPATMPPDERPPPTPSDDQGATNE